MAKPLTKEAFLEGKPFYSPDDLEIGIKKHYRSLENMSLECKNINCGEDYQYEANIRYILDDCVIFYRCVMGHILDAKVYYHEYNLVEEETADGTN